MWPTEYNLWDQKRSLYVNSEKSCLFLSSCSCWMLKCCCFRWNVIPCHLLWEGFWASVSKASLELVCFGEANSKFCAGIQFTILRVCVLNPRKDILEPRHPALPWLCLISHSRNNTRNEANGNLLPQPWYFGTSWLGHWFQSFVFDNTYGFVLWEVEPHTHFDLHSTSSKGLQSLITHWLERLFFLIAFNLLLVYFIRNLWYEK